MFVTFLGKDIPNSPFNVHVAENVGDISKVKLYGPGLQPEGNYCGKTTYFEIIAEGLCYNSLLMFISKLIINDNLFPKQTLYAVYQK